MIERLGIERIVRGEEEGSGLERVVCERGKVERKGKQEPLLSLSFIFSFSLSVSSLLSLAPVIAVRAGEMVEPERWKEAATG